METYHGHVRTPGDAIILFEACRLGTLPRVQRRLSEKERQSIKSGSVFVWDEREAGMRRWTDGKSWSASRVSGSFLTYREMEGKRGGRSDSDVEMGGGDEGPDGYRYKPDGLMKQSFSITTSTGNHLHLISYYSRSSPQATQLQQPSQDPALRHIRPPKGMYPESTVQEHGNNIPAVTRSPMVGHMQPQGPLPPYPGRGAPQPQNGAYVDPHMYQRPWPAPSTTSVPNGYPGYPPTSIPPNAPSYPSHPMPGYGHPMAQGPPTTSAPAYDGNLARPGVPTHHRSNSGSSLGPGSYASSRPSPHTGAANLVPPTSISRQASQANSPAGTPPSHQIDPRLMAPGANSLPPVQHTRREGATRTPSPVPRRDWNGTPVARDGPQIPGIGNLMNGARDHFMSGHRSGSGSPANTRREGPQDIPHDKLGFGEDMRALRVLDRAFKT